MAESEISDAHFNIKSSTKKNSNKSNSKLQKLDFSSPVPEGIALMMPHGQVSRKKQRQVKGRMLRVLFDSGASGSIVLSKHCAKARTTKVPTKTWETSAGKFQTDRQIKLDFLLPEFSESKQVQLPMTILEADMKYDIILGRDALNALGMILDFDKSTMKWDNVTIDMKHPDKLKSNADLYATFAETQEPAHVKDANKRVTHILDAKYEKADLPAIVKEQCAHLAESEQQALLALLTDYEDLFDGTLGDFDTEPVNLELKPDAQPVHSRPFPVPRVHEQTLKTEVERLCKIGVLKECSNSEWASPSFIIPKKNGTVRFIADLRKVNERLRRKPFPIPKISEIMQKLDGFQYATALDLNMGYYTIRLSPESQKICTIIFPWGKYQYLRLPMGVSCAPDVFQERMSDLMRGLEFARTYIDDLLVMSNSSHADHLDKLKLVLERLRQAGLKCNATKCTFCAKEIEYLGYWITRDGVKPLPNKVQTILNLEPPKTLKQLRRVLGIVQYYRDIWEKRSHLLAPLTDLVSTTQSADKKRSKRKFEWTEECQSAFNDMKKLVARDIMLAYPDFSQPFVIYTDASDRQLGAVITQNNRPLAFYGRKLNSAQRNYTTTERELLSIVETLKEFRSILLGQEIIVFTDHKNLVHNATLLSSERVTRWRLLIEEYGPDIKYIKGEANTVADALSRLDLTNEQTSVEDSSVMEEIFASSASDEDLFPVANDVIARAQASDSSLQKKRKEQPEIFKIKSMDGHDVIFENKKIYIPSSLRERTLNWYHHWLCHPGETRLEKTLRSTMTWPGLTSHAKRHCKTCVMCQKAKKQRRKYGKLPPKIAEAQPWVEVCVDCIGPYTIGKTGKAPKLQCLTMIDPASSWFEIAFVPEKDFNSARISQLFNQHWLCRYPRCSRVRYDNGSEFKLHFKQLCDDFGLKRKPTSRKNPQANSIIERVHQTIGNMIRSFNLDDADLDPNDPYGDLLASVAWAVRSTYHTTLEATPGQLVFGRDMIFDVEHQANWENIRLRKQRIINKSNEAENAKRHDHDYEIGDKVLLAKDGIIRKTELPQEGPYEIVQVHTNGTVRIQRGAVRERLHIRRLTPFKE